MPDQALGRKPVRGASDAPAWQRWFPFALVIAIGICVGWTLTLARVDFHVPYGYQGDALQYLAFFRTVFETGWYTDIPRLGAPFGTTHFDAPVPDGLFLLMVWVTGLFTDNPAIPFNLFVVGGYFAVAFAFFYAARDIGIDPRLALPGALAYAFLPFHVLRIGHLFYTLYFVHPLVLAAVVALNRSDLRSVREWLNVRRVLLFIVVGAAGVYGAFFAILVLMLSGATAAVAFRSRRHLVCALLASAVVGVTVVANLVPNLIYQREHGRNAVVAQRSFIESEVYALKLSQLLLPSFLHPIAPIRAVTSKYNHYAPLVNENNTASLGVIGALGFVVGLFVLLLRPASTGRQWKEADHLAKVNLVLFLFATIGGGAVMFAMLVSPQLRAWNRVSVVIGAASILIALLSIARWADARPTAREPRLWIAMSSLLAIVAIDEVMIRTEQLESTRATWAADRNYVREIAANLAPDSMILQMPYVPYPEAHPLGNEGPYEALAPYIHGTSLRWSYGAMKGRPEDAWNAAVARLPLIDQIEVAREAGFAGISLARNAYKDNGKSPEAELVAALGAPMVESTDKRLAFFRLPPERSGRVVPPMLELVEGFYGSERDAVNEWTWSLGSAKIAFSNFGQPLDAVFDVTIESLVPRSVVFEQDGSVPMRIDVPRGRVHVAIRLALPRGRSEIRLRTDEPPVSPGASDPRRLAFSLLNPVLRPIR